MYRGIITFILLLLAGGAQVQVSQPNPVNITQFGGGAVATGTGAGGAGIPRVTVSNDSQVRLLGNAGGITDAADNATASANGIKHNCFFSTTTPALTSGNDANCRMDSTGAIFVNPEGRKATYSTSSSFTPVAGDIAVLPGSATKTIRVLSVEIEIYTTGTAAISDVQLIKRSTADTAGTSAAMTIIPHDANFSAASAAPLQYTAAPTLGTSVGTVRRKRFNDTTGLVAADQSPAYFKWVFGVEPGASSITLRGVAQEICVNFSAVVATQTVFVTFEWTEE